MTIVSNASRNAFTRSAGTPGAVTSSSTPGAGATGTLASDEALAALREKLSGGQAQRVAIARAVALNPALIICDEAVSSLDVLIQAQVLNLFERLRAELGLSYLFIAHDLALVKQVSDRVAVMYLGKLCEVGPGEAVYRQPLSGLATLPLVAPLLLIALIFRTMEAFKTFDIAYVMSVQPTTELIAIRLYKLAFQEWQTGRSCALAYIVLIMVLAITNIYVKYLNQVKAR